LIYRNNTLFAVLFSSALKQLGGTKSTLLDRLQMIAECQLATTVLEDIMSYTRMIRAPTVALLGALFLTFYGWFENKSAAAIDQPILAGGLRVYFGAVPAEIVREHSLLDPTEGTIHGGIPTGVHEYHLVVAIFDAKSGARITDAAVRAELSAPGLSPTAKKLEIMERAGAPRYGGFFNLEIPAIYTVKLIIDRPGGASPVSVEIKYDHR